MHLNALSGNLRIYNQAMGSNPAGKVCMEVAEGNHGLVVCCCCDVLCVAVDRRRNPLVAPPRSSLALSASSCGREC